MSLGRLQIDLRSMSLVETRRSKKGSQKLTEQILKLVVSVYTLIDPVSARLFGKTASSSNPRPITATCLVSTSLTHTRLCACVHIPTTYIHLRKNPYMVRLRKCSTIQLTEQCIHRSNAVSAHAYRRGDIDAPYVREGEINKSIYQYGFIS